MFDLTVKNVDLFGDTVVAAQDKDGQKKAYHVTYKNQEVAG